MRTPFGAGAQKLAQYLGDSFGRLVSLFCDSDFSVASQLGISTTQFALAKAGLFTIAFGTLVVVWRGTSRRLNRHGFTDQVWRACFWILVAISALQILNILSQAFLGLSVPCPVDSLLVAFVLFMGLYAVWFFHLGQNKKGTFAGFVSIIAIPLYSDVALNVRQATVTGVRGLVTLSEFGVNAIGHLLTHV